MTRDEAVRRAVAAAERAETLSAQPSHRSPEAHAAVARAWAEVAHLMPSIEPADPGTPLADVAAAAAEALRTSDAVARPHVPLAPPAPSVPGTLNTCEACGLSIKLNIFGVWLAAPGGEPHCRGRRVPVVDGPLGFAAGDTQVQRGARIAMPTDADIKEGSDEGDCRYCGVAIAWRHSSVWLHVSSTGADEVACREPR